MVIIICLPVTCSLRDTKSLRDAVTKMYLKHTVESDILTCKQNNGPVSIRLFTLKEITIAEPKEHHHRWHRHLSAEIMVTNVCVL